VGRSIFERSGSESLAWGEGHVFLIGPDGVEIHGNSTQAPAGDTRLNRLYRGLKALHTLEINGRVWNGQRDGQRPDS
jgi:hypothetical protein